MINKTQINFFKVKGILKIRLSGINIKKMLISILKIKISNLNKMKTKKIV